jgi:hypothetical protein
LYRVVNLLPLKPSTVAQTIVWVSTFWSTKLFCIHCLYSLIYMFEIRFSFPFSSIFYMSKEDTIVCERRRKITGFYRKNVFRLKLTVQLKIKNVVEIHFC